MENTFYSKEALLLAVLNGATSLLYGFSGIDQFIGHYDEEKKWWVADTSYSMDEWWLAFYLFKAGERFNLRMSKRKEKTFQDMKNSLIAHGVTVK